MQKNAGKERPVTFQIVLPWLVVIALVPLTVAAGTAFLEDRKYYIISFLIIIYTLAAFFLSFEKRKPSARELSLLAVLCAFGVIGRAAFFWAPQFKPVAAVVILTAVCFGPMSGFMVGAVSALVSNIFFGQGPWTPWQMFAFGVVGFLAGILFEKGIFPIKKLPICIYGGVSVLVIYGGIMNTSGVLMGTAAVNTGTILSALAIGFTSDLVHAGSTVLFLLLFLYLMLDKLQRMKTKYGLFL